MIDIFCKAVIEKLNINKFIETGTFQGESVAQVSMWFSELYPQFGQIEKMVISGAKGGNPWNAHIAYPVFKAVSKNSKAKIYSVDCNPELYETAKELFSTNSNIILACRSSEQFIKELIDSGEISDSDNCFFFLDAHQLEYSDKLEYWPLHDEISQILRLNRFVIVIDDFVVPGHPDFGYDAYGKNIFDWGYIKDLFRDQQISFFYPVRSNRDNRGWILIVSGQERSLSSLHQLPLFRDNLWTRLSRPIRPTVVPEIRRKSRPLVWLVLRLGIRTLGY